MGKKKNGEDLQNTPVLEIKPSEEYHPRPMWQRIAAWIIIALICRVGTIRIYVSLH